MKKEKKENKKKQEATSNNDPISVIRSLSKKKSHKAFFYEATIESQLPQSHFSVLLIQSDIFTSEILFTKKKDARRAAAQTFIVSTKRNAVCQNMFTKWSNASMISLQSLLCDLHLDIPEKFDRMDKAMLLCLNPFLKIRVTGLKGPENEQTNVAIKVCALLLHNPKCQEFLERWKKIFAVPPVMTEKIERNAVAILFKVAMRFSSVEPTFLFRAIPSKYGINKYKVKLLWNGQQLESQRSYFYLEEGINDVAEIALQTFFQWRNKRI